MEGYTHVALGENMNSGISAETLDKLLNLCLSFLTCMLRIVILN